MSVPGRVLCAAGVGPAAPSHGDGGEQESGEQHEAGVHARKALEEDLTHAGPLRGAHGERELRGGALCR